MPVHLAQSAAVGRRANAFEVMNTGAARLKSGAANRAADLLEEALTIREAA